jgi:hypothetical protein
MCRRSRLTGMPTQALWTISYSSHPHERLWGYPCHEGNYGMARILSGAREVERLAK